jgi:hypothetical protein
LQKYSATGEAPNAQFRSLHVRKDADWAIETLLQFSDHREARCVIVMRPMAEIKSEHISARLEQPRQHLGR